MSGSKGKKKTKSNAVNPQIYDLINGGQSDLKYITGDKTIEEPEEVVKSQDINNLNDYLHPDVSNMEFFRKVNSSDANYNQFSHIVRHYGILTREKFPAYISKSFYDPREVQTVITSCQTCGKVIWEEELLAGIDRGIDLFNLMNNTGYFRVCCRKQIISDPLINKHILDRQDNDKKIDMLNAGQLTVDDRPFNRMFNLEGFVMDKPEQDPNALKFDVYKARTEGVLELLVE
jgi:hypothetical protein